MRYTYNKIGWNYSYLAVKLKEMLTGEEDVVTISMYYITRYPRLNPRRTLQIINFGFTAHAMNVVFFPTYL